jgi:hypothetical protein
MHRRTVIAAPFFLALAGCGVPIGQSSQPRLDVSRDYSLQGFAFAAQNGLIVSERENYYPNGDIVWRGDPRGPRIAQIAAMFTEAANRSKQAINGGQPVNVAVTLVRFHGVTNRTRYSIGGIYNVIFDITILDSGSGAVIEPTRRVVGNLDAPGGERAVQLEETGQTQKVRVTDFLTRLLSAQLI